MQTKLLLIYLVISGLFISSCNHKKQTTSESAKEYVVILSLDGFRWDYPDSTATPNLDKIARKGVKAEYLKPSFPTKTFPNHYSMATGLYPDHHGIVMNNFYDPTMDAYYSMGDSASRNNPAFYGGEPIWETAEKQGKIAGTFFWVGSDVAGADNKATYWKPYQQSIPFSARIDTVIQWLKKPADKRPDLVMWYYHEPDAIGHNAGPFAVETDSVIKMLDSLVGVFMTKIEALPYSDKINVLVTSDHGMNPISRERVVDLSAVAPAHWFEEIQGSNPAFAFKVKKSYVDSAYRAFQNTAHVTVWKSE
ncbi:MAG: ectonucleotide pyrophosphatase/phosphodiesterase, partial [Bacteroidota bacterium]